MSLPSSSRPSSRINRCKSSYKTRSSRNTEQLLKSVKSNPDLIEPNLQTSDDQHGKAITTHRDIKIYNKQFKKDKIKENKGIDPKARLVKPSKPKPMNDLYVPVLHSRKDQVKNQI